MNDCTAFGQATLTIPGANISIPLTTNALGNLTAHNATNATAAGQTAQNQQAQAQQGQQTNQTTANANAQNQQTQQSVNLQTHTLTHFEMSNLFAVFFLKIFFEKKNAILERLDTLINEHN